MDAIAGPVQGRRDPPRVRHIIASGLILCSGIFLTFAWTLPHVWAFRGGLAIALIAAWLLPAPRMKLIRPAIIAGLIAVYFLYLPMSVGGWHDKHYWESSISNAELLVKVLDSYASDHGHQYPIKISALLEEGYLPDFPQNMYCGRLHMKSLPERYRLERRAFDNMLPIGDDNLPDELRQYLDLTGNFAYLPRIVPDRAGGYTATGYSLLVFGRKRWEPGEWDKAYTMPTVAFYYNSETGVKQTWK